MVFSEVGAKTGTEAVGLGRQAMKVRSNCVPQGAPIKKAEEGLEH